MQASAGQTRASLSARGVVLSARPVTAPGAVLAQPAGIPVSGAIRGLAVYSATPQAAGSGVTLVPSFAQGYGDTSGIGALADEIQFLEPGAFYQVTASVTIAGTAGGVYVLTLTVSNLTDAVPADSATADSGGNAQLSVTSWTVPNIDDRSPTGLASVTVGVGINGATLDLAAVSSAWIFVTQFA